jgi:hypothetical protein
MVSAPAAFLRHLAALPGWQGPGGRRSYSWVDQRLRAGQFVHPDGTPVRPLRTRGGYRRFTTEMLRDIATSYRQHWVSMDKLTSVFRGLAIAAHRDTGRYQIPG